jgi:hypothetical protein
LRIWGHADHCDPLGIEYFVKLSHRHRVILY